MGRLCDQQTHLRDLAIRPVSAGPIWRPQAPQRNQSPACSGRSHSTYRLWDSWVPRTGTGCTRQPCAAGTPRSYAFLKEANLKRASIEEWLEEVVAGGELQDYENALQLAALIDKSYSDYRPAMRRSRIVLMSDGSVATTNHLTSLPPYEGRRRVGQRCVLRTDASREREQLPSCPRPSSPRRPGIRQPGGQRRRSGLLGSRSWPSPSGSSPGRFAVPESLSIINERTEPAKNSGSMPGSKMASSWVMSGYRVDLIPQTNIGDEHLLVDDQFHANDLALLRNLGARTTLADAKMTRAGGTYDLVESPAEASRLSDQSRTGPARLSEAGIRFTQALTTDGLHLLADASASTRAKVTRTTLSRPQYPTKVEFTQRLPGRGDHRRTRPLVGQEHGAFETPLGLVDTKHCVGQIEGIPTDYLPFPGRRKPKALACPRTQARSMELTSFRLLNNKLPMLQLHELYGALAVLGVRAPEGASYLL